MALKNESGAHWLSINVSDDCCCELGISAMIVITSHHQNLPFVEPWVCQVEYLNYLL